LFKVLLYMELSVTITLIIASVSLISSLSFFKLVISTDKLTKS
jgi:hypothetical protein